MKSQHSPLYRFIAFASGASLLLIALTPTPALQKPFPSNPPASRPAITSSITPVSQPENPTSPPAMGAMAEKALPSPQILATTPDSAERTQHVYRALLTPTGPLYANQPFLSRLGAAAAWQTFANTNNAPIIAVIDTGFALNHDSLKNRWHRNASENNGPYDADANGYPGDWQGWDFIHNDNDPRAGSTNPSGQAVTHGTITAGLASILNPNARIMPLQALDDNGVGYTNQVGAAVRYAADNGADIISLSLGSTTDDPYLHQQITYAISLGAVVVAAAGNDGCNCMTYPAQYPEVLAVGASDSANNTASFSSYGVNLDVLAPGTAGDVCSTAYTAANQTSAYTCSYAGTSLSTPIVAGLAALMMQQHPGANPATINTLIIRTAAKLPSMSGQPFTLRQGYGLAQAGGAIAAVTIAPPFGQLLSKTTSSLSSPTLEAGSLMDSTCMGIPGALCSMTLAGPGGQTISLGQKTLDEYGGAEFVWNASLLGLSPGQWIATATTTYVGQTKTNLQSFTIVP